MKDKIAAASLNLLGPRRLVLFARELPYHCAPHAFNFLLPMHAQEDEKLAPGGKTY